MITLNTASVHGDPSQLGCKAITVRFKEGKLGQIRHDLGDPIGSQLILFNYNQSDSTYTLTYINAASVVLKRISYARETVLEVCLEDSLCRLLPKTPLRSV